MKNLLLVAIAIFGFSAVSFGQTANATASATIQSPTGINKTDAVDMNFGNVIPGISVGTVVLSPEGVRTQTSPVVLNGGTVSAASFKVFGDPDRAYTITLPTTHTITRVGGTETMIVNTFTSTPTVAAKGKTDSSTGEQTLTVGATLNVGASSTQTAGTYTNPAGFEVTIAFE